MLRADDKNAFEQVQGEQQMTLLDRYPAIILYSAVCLWLAVGVFYFSGYRYLSLLGLYFLAVLTGYIATYRLFSYWRLRIRYRGHGDFFTATRYILPSAFLVITPALILGHYYTLGFFPLSKALAAQSPMEFALVRQSITADASAFWNYSASLLTRAVLPFFLVYFYIAKKKTSWFIWVIMATVYCLSLLQKSYIVIVFVPLILSLVFLKKYRTALLISLLPVVGAYLLFFASNNVTAKLWSNFSPTAIIQTTGEASGAPTQKAAASDSGVRVTNPFGAQPIPTSGGQVLRTDHSQGVSFAVFQYDFGKVVELEAAGVKDLRFTGGRAGAVMEYSEDGQNYRQYGSTLWVIDRPKTFFRQEPVRARYFRLSFNRFSWDGYAELGDFAIKQENTIVRYNHYYGDDWFDKMASESAFTRLSWIIEDALERFLSLPMMERIILAPGRGVVMWFDTFPQLLPFAQGSGYRVMAKMQGSEYVNLDRMVYDVNHPDMAAKGLLGTENAASFMIDYANFGKLGLVVSGFLLGLILCLVEALFHNDGRHFIIFNFYPIFILSSTALSSTIVSGGWGLTLILYFILLRNIEKKSV